MAFSYISITIFMSTILIIISPNPFCFPLCSACWNQQYDRCSGTNCRAGTGFSRPGGGSPYQCTKTWYNYLSTGAKWEPCGRSPDIPLAYNLGNSINVTAVQLVLNPSTKLNCAGSGQSYDYYGDLAATDIFTITHPGISDLVYFWQVRLIFGVLNFQQWANGYNITVQFMSNATSTNVTKSMSTNNAHDVCGTNGWGNKQQYTVVIADYPYSDPNGFVWQVTTNNPTATNKWGVLGIIVSIRLCHPYCTICTSDSNIGVCTACDYDVQGAKLSGQTCKLQCQPGYGDDLIINQAICILCDANCYYCQNTSSNCLGCNNSYFLYQNSTQVFTCLTACPTHYYSNTTGNDTCLICDANCQNCSKLATNCTTCYTGFYMYNHVCYNPCPSQMYANTTTGKCQFCNNYCTVCDTTADNCSVCDVSGPFKAYLKDGTTCVVQCGGGYYQFDNGGNGPNECQSCDNNCTSCDITPTNCFSCAPYYYLLNNTCGPTCPFPEYFTDDATWACLDCATYCVSMNMTLRWKNSLKEELMCDLSFSQALSWGPTEIAAFLKVTTNDSTIDLNAFNFVYEAITPKIMRLTISPKGYTFIYNVTFKFKTISLDPANYHYATNMYRFRDSNYDVQSSELWFLIKAPSLSQNQETIMDSVAKFSDKIQSVTTQPYIQQIKKAGAFAMIMGGAQITSTAVLVNTIPSQNFYEGVRFWAEFVFFDVPPWEQNSNKTKYMVVPNINDLIKNARLIEQQQDSGHLHNRNLFDTKTINWRFQRTGHTSFFIFDSYINIALIGLCWILLTIAHCCIKHKIRQGRMLSMFYSFTIKVHEISIFYIGLTTMLEWIYFDAASVQRWVSLGTCILFNVYFLFYELYIYYDMINYPAAQIGNKKYDYYVIKYGSLLKNIRFEQYDPHQQWSMKHWFRPYNYHIMSYYKKFLMMIALPIFYSTKNAQVSVLMFIQILQMIRFVVIWPFCSKPRNFIRLGLQCCLLLFFLSIFIQTMKMSEIMLSDPATLQNAVEVFYKVGWAGFGLVWGFNIGHIIIWIYDTVVGCRKSNRQMMDEARKFYYMRRLQSYEQQNEDVPLALVNKWVKLGNLNDRKYDTLPDLNLRIEYFRVLKTQTGYEIDMRKLFQIFLNIEFNYQKQNNITAGKKLNKRFKLTRSLSPQFYSVIEGLYNQYINAMDFQYMTIKTFQKVIQSQYSPGQKIQLSPQKMQQKIQLETYAGQKKVIKLDRLLPRFPLSYQDLKQFI